MNYDAPEGVQEILDVGRLCPGALLRYAQARRAVLTALELAAVRLDDIASACRSRWDLHPDANAYEQAAKEVRALKESAEAKP